MRAKVTILDIIGIDISDLDKRVLPRRPYLTACKPFGNWAAQTGSYWTESEFVVQRNYSSSRNELNGDPPVSTPHTYTSLMLNWYNLPTRWKWNTFIFRAGQVVVFDLHDEGSGLIFGKAKLTYEALMLKHKVDRDIISMYLEFQFANEFGGGRTGCVIRVHVDLAINTFVRSKKETEHWDKHRIHHWTNYPLTPVSTGVVRQKYKEVAEEYDQQKVIHPCFFGFSVRWRGNPEDESRFIHPMFIGFDLGKKSLPPALKSELERQRAMLANRNNPFKWDPNAAAAGKCIICSDGLPGCPRCFMMPINSVGEPHRVVIN